MTVHLPRRIRPQISKFVDKTEFEYLMDNHFTEPVSAGVSLSSTQSIPDSSLTQVSWDAVDYEVGGTWWSAGSPALLTVPYDGYYVCFFFYRWATDTVGNRRSFIYHNETTDRWGEQYLATIGDVVGTTFFIHDASSGDSFYASVRQSSGGNLNLLDSCRMEIFRLGR